MRIRPLDYLDTCFCSIIYASQKKEDIIGLLHENAFELPQHGAFCTCWNDVPNDAPNVPVLPGLSPLHMYSLISINPISLCFMHAWGHTERNTHARRIYSCVCVCTDLHSLLLCSLARQKQTLRSGNQLSAHLNQISTGCPGNHSATAVAGSQRVRE